ncbi:hypothetical protein GCM10007890_58070 [Methylobacterium tardum]|uniref:DUF6894 domain-containing protein n=1 Tax=Methylobacterium tardum TaxID=374432 RepID=A0AA37TKE6_9HYPH|nr:hypothetical protein GCM10007890_58070 [Methylobacterium tardum]
MIGPCALPHRQEAVNCGRGQLSRGTLARLPETQMPRFYIDTDDGRSAVIDEDGAEFRDLAGAEDEAMRSLP